MSELSAACVDQEKSGVGQRQQSVVNTESAGQGSSTGSSRGIDEDEELSEDGKVMVVDKRRNALLVCRRTVKRLGAAQVSWNPREECEALAWPTDRRLNKQKGGEGAKEKRRRGDAAKAV